jgi:hypothetical protein
MDYKIHIRYTDAMQHCLASILIIQMRLYFISVGDPLSYRLNFELILTEPVLVAVKTYDLNLPQICINAILAEIDRLNSTNSAVTQTTSSREIEIRELKEELQTMREKLKEAEATLATQKPWLWHR